MPLNVHTFNIGTFYMFLVALPRIVFANKKFLSCSLEIMEQMALLQETSYERLYRWTQSRTAILLCV